MKLLEELIEETEEFESEYVFLTNHGNPLSPDAARKHLRDLSERIGVNITGFHIFRHTASEMFLRQNGVTLGLFCACFNQYFALKVNIKTLSFIYLMAFFILLDSDY